MDRPGTPPRVALRRLADVLASAGYASLRYDKPGHGASKATGSWRGAYADETTALVSVLRHVRGRKDLGKVIILGESAGGYLACRAAKLGEMADAYVFFGALCGPAEEMYAHAFGSLARYVEGGPERLAWAEVNARRDLALGRHYKSMLEAAAAGKESVEIVDGEYRLPVGGLARRREELAEPPDQLFRHLKAPVLSISGERDLNVPSSHASKIAAIVREAGNSTARSIVIPKADHSFQEAPDDEEVRIRERYTFASFKRPYSPRLYQELLSWLRQKAPTTFAHSDVSSSVEPKTATTPERIRLAPGIEIIADITNRSKTAGVPTLEGRIGPLLLGEGFQSHFIDMPAGMFVAEHPHSTESMIYTVRGQWVLCSQGKRSHMKPGSLFRFAPNTPTGYEVPFEEPALILIFKGQRTTKVEAEFIAYLRGFADRLVTEQAQGIPFLLRHLPKAHPAWQFAGDINPPFAKKNIALPRVVLLGDSIRLGYAPLVQALLHDKALVISHESNGGDSTRLLQALDSLVKLEEPDVVHFNCGLHDLKKGATSGKHQVPVAAYEANLRKIIEKLRGFGQPRLIFASTTPILDDRHAKRKAGFDRKLADVKIYNQIANRVMGEQGVPINDLYTIIEGNNPPELLRADGTHFSAVGNKLLAEAVAKAILKELEQRNRSKNR